MFKIIDDFNNFIDRINNKLIIAAKEVRKEKLDHINLEDFSKYVFLSR